MTNVWLVARLELRLLRADPYPFVLLVLMPLALLAFLSDGVIGGPAQSVPGILVLFAFIGLYNVGLVFFREHGWRTWGRLRTLPVTTKEIVLGKVIPLVAMYLVQAAVLLGVGYLLFDMPMNGDLATLVAVVVVVVASLSSLGLLLVSVCRTMNQVAAAANIGGLFLAGLGGALGPVRSLPEWMQAIAPLSPVYWALGALRGVIVLGEPLSAVSTDLAVLVGVTVVSAVIAVTRFDSAQDKEYYA